MRKEEVSEAIEVATCPNGAKAYLTFIMPAGSNTIADVNIEPHGRARWVRGKENDWVCVLDCVDRGAIFNNSFTTLPVDLEKLYTDFVTEMIVT
jgi:hypothetical protein